MLRRKYSEDMKKKMLIFDQVNETYVSLGNHFESDISNGYNGDSILGSANKKNIKELIAEEEQSKVEMAYNSSNNDDKEIDHSECLYNLQQIACLEDLLGAVTIEFSKTGCELSSKEQVSSLAPPAIGAHGIAASAQDCILSVEGYWNWISTLVKCSNIHLENTANYHKFFHEVKELKNWMPSTLLSAQSIVVLEEHSLNNIEMTKEFSQDLKELSSLFIHWTTKVNSLWDRSKKVHPIPERLKSCNFQKPVIALCNYKTKEINVRDNEELILVDNTNPHFWKVRSLNSQESTVPSIICLLPAPCAEAIAAAQQIRVELLTLWTIQIKRIGKNLILFLMFILSDITEKDLKYLRANVLERKNEITDIFKEIGEGFSPVWDGYKGFNEFSGKAIEFKSNLSSFGEKGDGDAVKTNIFIDKLMNVANLMRLYQIFWKQWDTYRILVQSSMEPDSILIVNKIQKLKFVNRDYLKKIWQAEMSFDGKDDADFLKWMSLIEDHWNINDEIEEEVITIEENEVVNMTPPLSDEEFIFEEVIVHEESKSFIISGVIHPITEKEISLKMAIAEGIINNEAGAYVNKKTGQMIPIPEAINMGLINMS